jgi:hypothetical protein
MKGFHSSSPSIRLANRARVHKKQTPETTKGIYHRKVIDTTLNAFLKEKKTRPKKKHSPEIIKNTCHDLTSMKYSYIQVN